jgi:hypothetical protein
MDKRWEKVAGLDLQPVRQKFAIKKGFWWRVRWDAERIEQEYRQFLYLIICNPDKTVIPWSGDLDDFWHEHILDTAKYAQDCNTILGGFIHHNPHSPKNTISHGKALEETRKMYEAAFSESIRKGRNRTKDDVGCSKEMPVAFYDGSSSFGHHHGHHHAGDPGTSGHAGHHSCGASHGGGHSCGGHSCGHGGGH